MNMVKRHCSLMLPLIFDVCFSVTLLKLGAAKEQKERWRISKGENSFDCVDKCQKLDSHFKK